MAEINARRIICPKNAHGVIGSCDYTSQQEAATSILLYIYASAKHSHAMNAEGQSSNKYANLQSKYVGNLVKIKNFKCHMDARDVSHHFVIPTLMLCQWNNARLKGIDRVHLLTN